MILRSMGGDIEIEKPRESGAEPVADLRVRASRAARHPGARGAGAARDRRVSGAVHRGRLRRGRDRGHRRGGIARQRERPDRRDERRLDGAGRGRTASARRHADRGPRARARLSAAARSTASAITASPCPLPSPACAPPGPIVIRDVANVATSFPGFVAAGAIGRPDLRRIGGLRRRHDKMYPS